MNHRITTTDDRSDSAQARRTTILFAIGQFSDYETTRGVSSFIVKRAEMRISPKKMCFLAKKVEKCVSVLPMI
jgi:hypothetical protein